MLIFLIINKLARTACEPSSSLRSGTRHLRKTQEYPAAFAKAIAVLHLEDVKKVLQIPNPLITTLYLLVQAKDPPGLTLDGILNANLVASRQLWNPSP